MSRNKGKKAERAVVNWLRDNGFPHCERKGSGLPGADVAELGPGLELEVKDKQPANMRFGTWLDKLADDMAATDAAMGAVIVKRRQCGHVEDWFFLQPRHLFDTLTEGTTTYGRVRGKPQYEHLGRDLGVAVSGARTIQGSSIVGRPVPYLQIARPRSKARDHYVITTVAHGVRLLRQAGWGDPIEPTKETTRP